MALGAYQLVVKLSSVSSMPEDSVENVLHVGWDTIVGYQDFIDATIDFFNVAAPTASAPLATRISDSISRAANQCSVSVYEINDLTGATPMGSPVKVQTFTMGASDGTSPMPEEVATVISFNADLTNAPVSQVNPTPPPAFIRPQSRRRGRMYVGPLQISAGTDVGLVLRPSTNWIGDLGKAFKELAETVNAVAPGDNYLGIWSRADAEVHEIIAGYVDNAWDTQRRRGLAPTSRTPFTIS